MSRGVKVNTVDGEKKSAVQYAAEQGNNFFFLQFFNNIQIAHREAIPN